MLTPLITAALQASTDVILLSLQRISSEGWIVSITWQVAIRSYISAVLHSFVYCCINMLRLPSPQLYLHTLSKDWHGEAGFGRMEDMVASALQTRGLQHLPKGERQKLLKLLLEVCGLRWLLPGKLD